jgi:hypothetical protein
MPSSIPDHIGKAPCSAGVSTDSVGVPDIRDRQLAQGNWVHGCAGEIVRLAEVTEQGQGMPEHLSSRDLGFRDDGVGFKRAIAKIAAVGIEVVADQSGLIFDAETGPNTQCFRAFSAGHSGPAQSLCH